jgi:HK97 family phage major capsid protein
MASTEAPESTTRSAKELREELEGLGEKVSGLRQVSERDENWRRDMRSAVDSIGILDAELRVVEMDHQIRSVEKRDEQPETNGPSAALATLDGDIRSAGQMFTDSEQYQNRSGRVTEPVEIRALVHSGTTTGGPGDAGYWLPKAQPVAPVPRQRRAFLRDLLSVQQTGFASIPYIRELNAAGLEGGASAVGEASAKPEVTQSFEAADAPVRKLAAWIPVTDEIVEDAPTLRGYIDTRLLYMLMLREEQQILDGSGTAPQIRGIRETTGTQTQAFTTDAPTTIGNAISKIQLVDGDPDAIVINPTDLWAMFVDRHAEQFDFGFGGNLPYGSPPNTVWGLRYVATRGIAAGDALVGAFALGATLFERSAPSVRTYDQHSDYAVLNKLVILVEERVALAVHRPDFFVETDVSA